MALGRRGIRRVRGAVGHVRLGVLLGRGVQAGVPDLVTMAVASRIRRAVRRGCRGVLACERCRRAVAACVVLPPRGASVAGGPRHRDQARPAPSAAAF